VRGLTGFILRKGIHRPVDFTVEAIKLAKRFIAGIQNKTRSTAKTKSKCASKGPQQESKQPERDTEASSHRSSPDLATLVQSLPRLEVVIDFSSFLRSYLIQQCAKYDCFLEGDLHSLDVELAKLIRAFESVCYIIDAGGDLHIGDSVTGTDATRISSKGRVWSSPAGKSRASEGESIHSESPTTAEKTDQKPASTSSVSDGLRQEESSPHQHSGGCSNVKASGTEAKARGVGSALESTGVGGFARFISVPVIRLHVVLDGGIELFKMDTWDKREEGNEANLISQMQKLYKSLQPSNFSTDICNPPKLYLNTLAETLMRAGCRVIMADGDGDVVTMALARRLKAFAIIASDSDYYVVPNLGETMIVDATKLQVQTYHWPLSSRTEGILTRFSQVLAACPRALREKLEALASTSEWIARSSPPHHAPTVAFDPKLLPVRGEFDKLGKFIPTSFSAGACPDCYVMPVQECICADSVEHGERAEEVHRAPVKLLGICYRNPYAEALQSVACAEVAALLPAVTYLLDNKTLLGEVQQVDISVLHQEILQLLAALAVDLPHIYRFHSPAHSHVTSVGVKPREVANALELPLCVLPWLGIACKNDFMDDNEMHRLLAMARGPHYLNAPLDLIRECIKESLSGGSKKQAIPKSLMSVILKFFATRDMRALTKEQLRVAASLYVQRLQSLGEAYDRTALNLGLMRSTPLALTTTQQYQESTDPMKDTLLPILWECVNSTRLRSKVGALSIDEAVSGDMRHGQQYGYKMLGHAILYLPMIGCPEANETPSQTSFAAKVGYLSRLALRMVLQNPIVLSDRGRFTGRARYHENASPFSTFLVQLFLAHRILNLCYAKPKLEEVWNFPYEPFDPHSSAVVRTSRDDDVAQLFNRLTGCQEDELEIANDLARNGIFLPIPFVRMASVSDDRAVHIAIAAALREHICVLAPRIPIGRVDAAGSFTPELPALSLHPTNRNHLLLFTGTQKHTAIQVIEPTVLSAFRSLVLNTLPSLATLPESHDTAKDERTILNSSVMTLEALGTPQSIVRTHRHRTTKLLVVRDPTHSGFVQQVLNSDSSESSEKSAFSWASVWVTIWELIASLSRRDVLHSIKSPYSLTNSFNARDFSLRLLTGMKKNVVLKPSHALQPLLIELDMVLTRRLYTTFFSQSPHIPKRLAYALARRAFHLRGDAIPLADFRELAPLTCRVRALRAQDPGPQAPDGEALRELVFRALEPDSCSCTLPTPKSFVAQADAEPDARVNCTFEVVNMFYAMEFDCIALPPRVRKALHDLDAETIPESHRQCWKLASSRIPFAAIEMDQGSSTVANFACMSQVPEGKSADTTDPSTLIARGAAYNLLSAPALRCILDAQLPYYFDYSRELSRVSATGNSVSSPGGLRREWYLLFWHHQNDPSSLIRASHVLRTAQSFYLYALLYPTDPSIVHNIIIPGASLNPEAQPHENPLLPGELSPSEARRRSAKQYASWLLNHPLEDTSQIDQANLLPSVPGWLAIAASNLAYVAGQTQRPNETADPYLGHIEPWIEVTSAWRYVYLGLSSGRSLLGTIELLGHHPDPAECGADVGSQATRKRPATATEQFAAREFQLASYIDYSQLGCSRPQLEVKDEHVAWTSKDLISWGIDLLLLTAVLAVETTHGAFTSSQAAVSGLDLEWGGLSSHLMKAFAADTMALSARLEQDTILNGLPAFIRDHASHCILWQHATGRGQLLSTKTWQRLVYTLSIAYDHTASWSSTLSALLGKPFVSYSADLTHLTASAFELAKFIIFDRKAPPKSSYPHSRFVDTSIVPEEKYVPDNIYTGWKAMVARALHTGSEGNYLSHAFGVDPVQVWSIFFALRSGILFDETNDSMGSIDGRSESYGGLREDWSLSRELARPKGSVADEAVEEKAKILYQQHLDYLQTCSVNAGDEGELFSRSVICPLPAAPTPYGFSMCSHKSLFNMDESGHTCGCHHSAIPQNMTGMDILGSL